MTKVIITPALHQPPQHHLIPLHHRPQNQHHRRVLIRKVGTKLIHLIHIRRMNRELCKSLPLAANTKIALTVAPNRTQYVCGINKDNAMRVLRDKQRDFGGNYLIHVRIILIFARLRR